MAIKFSQFVVETSASTMSHIVGYDGADNIQITPNNFFTSFVTGTTGQVPFFGSTTSLLGDAGFNWDNTNKRLGVGTTAPESKLTIKGDPGNTSQPVRITNTTSDIHTGLFLNGTGNAVGEKYGMQFGGYNQYSIGGIFGVMDSTSASTSGDITFDLGNGTAAGALIERMRVTHEGNVGIGTASPGTTLDVVGTLASSGITQLGTGGSNVLLTSASAGNVGIGSSSPSYKLDIYGDSSSGIVRVKNVANGRDTLRSENAAGTRTLNFGNDGSGNGILIIRDSAGNVTNYITGSGDSYFNGGNIGIGTTSPNAKLDVNGGLNSTHAIFSGQDGRGLKLSTQNTLNNDDGVVYDAQTSTGKHLFKTSGTERMRIDDSSATFAVSATIRKSSLGGSTPMADGSLVLGAGSTDYYSFRLDSNADLYLDKTFGGTAANVLSIDRSSTNGNITFAGTIGGGNINISDGTPVLTLTDTSSSATATLTLDGVNLTLQNNGTDGDFTIKGKDGSSTINLLAFDASEGGNATFAGDVNVTAGKVDITQSSATDPVLRLTDDGVANYDFIFPDASTIKLETNTSSTKTFKLLNAGSGDFNFEASSATFAGNIIMGDNDVTGIDELVWTSGTKLRDNNTNYLQLNYASGGAGGILIVDGDNTTQGYIYADGQATSSFGLLDGSGSWAVKCVEDAEVELRYDNSKKFETTNIGVSVTGDVIVKEAGQQSTFETSGNDLVLSANSGQTNVTPNIIFKSSVSGGAINEKMRISSSGYIYVNTGGAEPGASQVGVRITGTQGQAFWNSANSGTTGYNHFNFYNDNGAVGSIVTNGSATAFNTSSDYRLKEDLQDFNGLDKVSKIPVYDFKWKVDDSRSYGVLAHELQEVVPNAVNGEKDAEEMQGVDYSKVVPLLVKSIQELKAEVEDLKSKI